MARSTAGTIIIEQEQKRGTEEWEARAQHCNSPVVARKKKGARE